MEGHDEPEEQPPAEVTLVELKRRAGIMLSGETGAAVASGDGAVMTAPSYGLAKDASKRTTTLERGLASIWAVPLTLLVHTASGSPRTERSSLPRRPTK